MIEQPFTDRGGASLNPAAGAISPAAVCQSERFPQARSRSPRAVPAAATVAVLWLGLAPAAPAWSQPIDLTKPLAAPSVPLTQSVLPPVPAVPTETYVLQPGHWALHGADWVWVPPETAPRLTAPYGRVPGQYVWKHDGYVWEPSHLERD